MAFDWTAAMTVLKPLGIFVLGIAAYAVFVFKVYIFLAKRDILKANLAQYNTASHPVLRKTLAGTLYVIEYLLFLPLCIMFWSVIFTVLLVLLSKNQGIDKILLLSMAVVGAVRVAAHYNEELAKDLSKTLPLALLAVFLTDTSYVHMDVALAMLQQIPSYFATIAYYFFGVMALELVLRILGAVFGSEA